MLKRSIFTFSNEWYSFTKTARNGEKLKFHWKSLPQDRFEELIDFVMKYFVTREFSHTACEISKNPEAMEEYRPILAEMYADPLYHTSICCLENKTNDIVAFDSVKLCRRGESFKNPEYTAQTPELRNLFHLNQVFDEIYPVSQIMDHYGIDTFFEDANAAAHPDIRGYNISAELDKIRCMVTKANGVPMTGAWLTASVLQQAVKGCELFRKLTIEEVENLVGIKVKGKHVVQQIEYIVKRIV